MSNGNSNDAGTAENNAANNTANNAADRPADKTAGKAVKSGFLMLIISVSLATFMSALDGTIVNVALPTISQDFMIPTSTVSWVSTSYLLAMAGSMLIVGKIADRVGYKKIFILGFAIFTAGSFACGYLPVLLDSFYALIIARIFQAVGGAMITAITAAMITAYLPFEERGRAMGIIMTTASLGMAIGPTVGGVLTQYLTWHWIFYINVPVGILAVILSGRHIPADRTTDRSKFLPFDKAGSILIFAGLASLMFWISEGSTFGWTSAPMIASVVAAVVFLGAFYVRERGCADPILDFGLFKDRNFLLLNLLASILFLSYSGVNYLLPFYLEYVQGFDVAFSGIVLAALSFSLMAGGLISGALFNKVGGKRIVLCGTAVILIGYLMMVRFGIDTSLAYIVPALFLVGLGLGMSTIVINLIVNSVPRAKSGMVASITGLERFAPMTIGIAVYNLIFVEALSYLGHRAMAIGNPVSDMAAVFKTVLAHSFEITFTVAVVFGAALVVMAFFSRQVVHEDYITDANRELVEKFSKR